MYSCPGQAVSRARTPPGRGYRFLGFAPHEQDYEPSADQFANMNSAVHTQAIRFRSQVWFMPDISIGSIFLAVPGELDASAGDHIRQPRAAHKACLR